MNKRSFFLSFFLDEKSLKLCEKKKKEVDNSESLRTQGNRNREFPKHFLLKNVPLHGTEHFSCVCSRTMWLFTKNKRSAKNKENPQQPITPSRQCAVRPINPVHDRLRLLATMELQSAQLSGSSV
jgi:hypothetical protein